MRRTTLRAGLEACRRTYVREFAGITNRCLYVRSEPIRHFGPEGLSHIATNKAHGRETVGFGDGKQVRDALHVRDVVVLLMAQMPALTSPAQASVAGPAFNVGGGLNNIIYHIELCRKWESRPRFGNWRPADQKVFYCDISAAQSAFGWRPVTAE